MSSRLINFLITCLFLGLAWPVAVITQAQSPDPSSPPVMLTDEQDHYPLGMHLAYLEDPTGNLTINQVSDPAYADQFTPSQSEPLNLGLTGSIYWLRFRVNNQAVLPAQWLLEMQFPSLHALTLYSPSPDGTGFVEKQTGYTLPFSTREVPHRNFVFNLVAPPQTTPTYYLRVKNSVMNLPLVIWSATAFGVKNQLEYLWFGLFFGGLLIIAVYNSFLFISLRDRLYLYFTLYIGVIILYQAAVNGLAS